MKSLITKITSSREVTLITLESAPSQVGFLSDVFGEVARQQINVDMISQSAPTGNTVSVSFTVSDEDMPKVLKIVKGLSAAYPEVRSMVSSSNVKINLFGENLPAYCGVAAEAFSALKKQEIDILMITTSDVDISLLIPEAFCENALSALHEQFSC